MKNSTLQHNLIRGVIIFAFINYFLISSEIVSVLKVTIFLKKGKTNCSLPNSSFALNAGASENVSQPKCLYCSSQSRP